MTSSCHACGYDLSGIPTATRSCPECGVERSPWAARWPLRMADLGLAVCLWSSAIAGAAWAINSVIGMSQDSWSPRRSHAVLLVIPAVAFAAGLSCLTSAIPRRTLAARLFHAISAVTAAAAAVWALYSWWPGRGSGPAWLDSLALASDARIALEFLVPLAVGVWLANLSALAAMLGLEPIARVTRSAARWLPAGAIAALIIMYIWGAFATPAGQSAPARTPTTVSAAPRAAFPPNVYYLGWVLIGTALFLAVAATWMVSLIVRIRLRDALTRAR